jgi:hypothetical protein
MRMLDTYRSVESFAARLRYADNSARTYRDIKFLADLRARHWRQGNDMCITKAQVRRLQLLAFAGGWTLADALADHKQPKELTLCKA